MTWPLFFYLIAFGLFMLNVVYPRPWNALGLGLAAFVLGHILAGAPFKL